MGDYFRAIQGDTRSLDYGSYVYIYICTYNIRVALK